MLKAIIFDCDGVIADTEPLHFMTLRQVLEENGFSISKQLYMDEYLAFDDRGCFTKAFADHQAPLSPERLKELISRKAALLEPVMNEHLALFPGVADFVARLALRYPLAIASGARRQEIDLILHVGGLQDHFLTIISTEDVRQSKPHPEAFLKAYESLKQLAIPALAPQDCLVIEDSIYGIEGALAAGMKCLAVTNSYGREHLSHATSVVESLEGLTLKDVEQLFET